MDWAEGRHQKEKKKQLCTACNKRHGTDLVSSV
jgi:hypothetical protein